MQINIGTPDRIIRLVLGIVLVLLPFVASLTTLWTWVSVVVGIVLVLTAVLRFCPAYSILGIRTGGEK